MDDAGHLKKRTTEAARAKFLELLAEGHTVKHAAEKAGIPRSTVYALRDSDEAFRAAWDEANEAGVQVLEEEARRRAVEGVEDVKMIGFGEFAERVTVRKYSDTLLIFLLKAKRPNVYRDNAKVEVTGADGGPVQVEARKVVSLADVVKLAADLGVPADR